jgi:hypothetical protein
MYKEEAFIIRKIKGTINETIVEFMLKELGFYVIKLGQEHKVEPIVQLESFINIYNPNFNIGSRSKISDGFEQIRTLPDFLIVKDRFRPVLLEAKYRATGIYFNKNKTHPKLERLFNFYFNSYLLLTCSNLLKSEYQFRLIFPNYNGSYDSLLNSKFHILYKSKKNGLIYCSFREWLSSRFCISDEISLKNIDLIIKKYEKLVDLYL